MKNNTSESHTTTKVPGLCLNGGWEEEEDGGRKQNGRFHFHSVLVRRETRRGGGRLTGGPNVPTSRDICSPRNGHQKDKSLFHRGPPAGLFRDLSAPFLMSVVHQPVPPVLPSLLCIHSLYARGRRRDSDEMQKPSYPVAVGVHFWKWGEVKHPFVMGGPRTAFKRCGRSATTSVVLCVRFLARPHALTDGNLTAIGDVRTQPIWMRTTGRHTSVRDGGGRRQTETDWINGGSGYLRGLLRGCNDLPWWMRGVVHTVEVIVAQQEGSNGGKMSEGTEEKG